MRPPYLYGGEFVAQFLFILRLCWFPLLISTVCINYAAPGLQAANFLRYSAHLTASAASSCSPRSAKSGPSSTAIVLAGVAGTAITADLGARKIREELDALQVLGVDPVKNLVVPRFLALMLVTGLFNIYAMLFGLFGGIIAELVYHQPLGPFWATSSPTPTTTDLWGSALKTVIYGAIIAIVCCYKGMTASGGAEGVGRAVNQAVVMRCSRSGRSTTSSPRPCSPPTPRSRHQVNELLASPREWIYAAGEIGGLRRRACCARSTGCASCASSARPCARPGS